MGRSVWNILLSGCLALCGSGAATAQSPDKTGAIWFASHEPIFTGESLSLFDAEFDTPGSLVLGNARPVDPWQESTTLFLDDSVDETEDALQLAQYPFMSSAAEDLVPEEALKRPGWETVRYLRQQLDRLPKDKRGLTVSDSSATITVLPESGSNGFLFSTLDVRTSLAPARFPVFRVTPRFGWHLTGGTDTLDVPSQLYDTGLDASLFIPLSQKLTVMTMVGPSLFSDGENTSSDAFRMTAMALGFYQWSDTTKVAFGFMYLDRQDIRALPAVGVTYRPSDRFKLDVFFPRPKLAYRLTANERREHWAYLAGEFGGGSWAVQRATGADDILTYRDYRFIAGLEQASKEAVRWLVEGGFVFNREIEYRSNLGNVEPGSTGMIRMGLIF